MEKIKYKLVWSLFLAMYCFKHPEKQYVISFCPQKIMSKPSFHMNLYFVP